MTTSTPNAHQRIKARLPADGRSVLVRYISRVEGFPPRQMATFLAVRDGLLVQCGDGAPHAIHHDSALQIDQGWIGIDA